MTKPLRFDDEAVEEMDAAAVWYEASRCPYRLLVRIEVPGRNPDRERNGVS